VIAAAPSNRARKCGNSLSTAAAARAAR